MHAARLMTHQRPGVKAVAQARAAGQDRPMTDAAPAPSSRFSRTLRRWGPRAVFESLLIVVSIMLALAAHGWVGEQQTQARVREARAYFVQEISANRALLASDEYLPHHQRLREALRELSNPITAESASSVSQHFRTGVHFAPLRDAVWRSFSNSDLMQHLPPEEVFVLNDVYRAQEQLAEIHSGFYPIGTQIPARIQSGDFTVFLSLQLYLGDVVGGEEQIIGRYDAALAQLED
jgi:hypothetical protein